MGYPLLAFLIFSCASPDLNKLSAQPGDVSETDCSEEASPSDEKIRAALYHTMKTWDMVRAYVRDQKGKGLMSDESLHAFAVQDDEFAKYFTNALMLYLRGDLSPGLCRSLYTLEELLVIAASCYPGISEEVRMPLGPTDCCEPPLPPEHDQDRAILYRIKNEWDEFFLVMLGKQVRRSMSADELSKFRELDQEFRAAYADACMLYLGGQASSEAFGASLERLGEIGRRSRESLRDNGK